MITSPHQHVWRIATHIPNSALVTHTYSRPDRLSHKVFSTPNMGFVTEMALLLQNYLSVSQNGSTAPFVGVCVRRIWGRSGVGRNIANVG